jgi:hypothetical protein
MQMVWTLIKNLIMHSKAEEEEKRRGGRCQETTVKDDIPYRFEQSLS